MNLKKKLNNLKNKEMKVTNLTQEQKQQAHEIWIDNYDNPEFVISQKADEETNVATSVKTSLKEDDIVVYEATIKGVTITAYFYKNTDGKLFRLVRSNGTMTQEIPKELHLKALEQMAQMGITF